jgi:hypothetical protein
MLIEHLLVLSSLCFFNIHPYGKRRRNVTLCTPLRLFPYYGRRFLLFRMHYMMLHDVPFNLKLVGAGLLPLHEPSKPGLAEAPAGSEAL